MIERRRFFLQKRFPIGHDATQPFSLQQLFSLRSYYQKNNESRLREHNWHASGRNEAC